MNRRKFIRNLAAAPLAAGSFIYGNPFNPVIKTASAMEFNGKTLVVIFQRGGCDGLNTVIPYGDDEYYNLRPTIGIAPPSISADSALDLDGFLGLHPRLAPLHNLYQQGVVAVMPTVQYDNASRSHFDGQNYIESGVPEHLLDGWLNRHMASFQQDSILRSVSVGNELVHALRGSESVMTFNNISDFSLGNYDSATIERLLAIYNEPVINNPNRSLVHKQGQIMLNNLEALAGIANDDYIPENGAVYPNSGFGRQLIQVAQLVKSGVGLELAAVNIGGWDTHANQGGAIGNQANRHADFASGIAALYSDLGAFMDNVVILTMTEFGRTAKENASRGTDHGNASSWFAIGNSINGGVYGAGTQWPGLLPDQLYQGRYLANRINYSDVLSEVVSRHLGNSELAHVIPNHSYNPVSFLS